MNFVFLKPATVNNGASNGGAISLTPIFDSLKENLFPDVRQDEIITGLTRYRKFFLTPAITADYLKACLTPSTGADGFLLHAGTDTDTQTEAEAYTHWKGTGLLKTGISSGLLVSLEVMAEVIGQGFSDHDFIRISDGVNEDYVRLDSVTWAGNVATLNCASLCFIQASYAAGSVVSACVELFEVNQGALWVKEIITPDVNYCFENEVVINLLVKE